MPELKLKRIAFTEDADKRLRSLKSRTGITPNILCRLGFCLSLEEAGIPSVYEGEDAPGRIINRYTLLGEYDQAFIALLATWMQGHGIDDFSDENMEVCFMSHINRGIELLSARLKGLSDLERLVPSKV